MSVSKTTRSSLRTAAPHTHRAIASDAFVFPVSFAQQRLWFLDRLAPGNPVYNLSLPLRFTLPLDPVVLEAAINEIVRRHELLRTTFAEVDGHPVQVVAPSLRLAVGVEDLRGVDEAERRTQFLSLAAEYTKKPFDLSAGPLVRPVVFRLTEQESLLVVTMHHIVSDGWSMGLFCQEFAALYSAFVQGKPSPLPDLRIQYSDFAVWQRQRLTGPTLEADLRYWAAKLRDLPVLELPTDRARPAMPSYRGGYHALLLSPSLSSELRRLSQRAGTTLFMTLLAGFVTLLSRYTGLEDVVVGSPIAGRNRSEVEHVIGFFVNTLVLRTDLSGEPTFRELLKRVQFTAREAYAHGDLPFEILVEKLQPPRDLGRNPLFQVMFQLINLPTLSQPKFGPAPPSLDFKRDASPFDLAVTLADGGDRIAGVIEYSLDLFDAETMARFAEHLESVLGAVAADPDVRLAEVPLLNPEERRRLVAACAPVGRAISTPLLAPHRFEAQVERTPERLAISHDGAAVTYCALNRRANRVAHGLIHLGVGPETVVAACLPDPIDMVVAILGILKAGAAYTPLDPDDPSARHAFVVQDSGARLVLTDAGLGKTFDPSGAKAIGLDELTEQVKGAAEENPVSVRRGDQLAYLLYTSGSTGKPKGVEIDHANLAYSTDARFSYYLSPVERFLLLSPFVFDSSVAGIFWTLCGGGTLRLTSTDLRRDPRRLMEVIRQERISHLLCLPRLYRELLAAARPGELASLRTVIVAGEAAPGKLLAAHVAQLADVPLFNEYGPTEATVWSTVHRCSPDDIGARTLPIGRPLAHVRALVLDDRREPLPPGLPGELHIGGPGIARGYRGSPELTAERFIDNPFIPEAPGRLYRTGDLVRQQRDGTLHFLGRRDDQVKLRGIRIELGEVEAALAEHAGVAEVVAQVREDSPGDQRLVTYVVPAADSPPTGEELRQLVRRTRPGYMVPAAVVFVDALPRNANGKVDRRSLPPVETLRLPTARQHEAPRTPAEKLLARIWGDVLRTDRVDIRDDFFADLGGHSLLAIQVVARAADVFDVELSVRELFEAPTVAQFAEVLGRHGPSMERIEEAARLLEGLAAAGDTEDASAARRERDGRRRGAWA